MQIEPFWDSASCLVVGVSGGMDSMVLLDLLRKQRESFAQLIVAHVNHGMRQSAIEDQLFVQAYCQQHNIMFQTNQDVPHLTSEQDARVYRYRFFDQVIASYQGTHLVLAHHQQDQVETVLMNLIRGKSLQAISGMVNSRAYKSGVQLVRPLLRYTRQDIENYQQTEQLAYVEDETNQLLTYTRNRFRHDILPVLRKEQGTSDKQVSRFAEQLREKLEVIEVLLEPILASVIEGDRISGAQFRAYPHSIQTEIVQHYLEKIDCLTWRNVAQVLRLMQQTNGERYIDLGQSKRFCVSYGDGFLLPDKKPEEWHPITVSHEVPVSVSDWMVQLTLGMTESSVLEVSDDQLPLVVRRRRDGDVMTVNGMTKKISRLCIDLKIPKFERSELLVVVDKMDKVLAILDTRLLPLSKYQETGKMDKYYLNCKRGRFYD